MKTIILLLLCAYGTQADRTVDAIPLPAGFHRASFDAESFAAWLRKVPLKKDNTVYLYNGQRKANQGAQFAVLNISVGHEDLQQCADAVMRLRAEYLFSIHDFKAIDFYTEQGTRLNFAMWAAERKVVLVGNATLAGPYFWLDPARGCADPGRIAGPCHASHRCGRG